MTPMNRVIGGLAALTLGACTAGALAGCGSGSKPASSVASAPETQTSASTATSSTPATTTTRTAPEPEFAEQEHHAPGLQEAVAELQARGYTASDTSEYHAGQTLRVLVGTKTGSEEGHEQQAFFFVDGRYIGTDTKNPSATVEVISQSDTEVTLGYPLYRAGDPLSSPSDGRATVTFALNDGKLAPLQAIPPASSSTGPSRR
jgi:hypothetical protein